MSQPHGLSLLSLSIAAAEAPPIPAPPIVAESVVRASPGSSTNTTKHRRLSSAGRSRRRLSDARDAATRPLPTSLQTASASLAALSLSSPTVSHRTVLGGAQPIQVSRTSSTKGTPEPTSGSLDDTFPPSHPSNSVNVAKPGRKRGTIFTCESCSKVYRHPSCLIKHRWEHTPQWREASKFVLSKHQQVQLLEAAAILSHLSPSSASLPEDRSLWPSFLSGGLVPPPASANNDVGSIPNATTVTSPPVSESTAYTSFPFSSSVPTSTLSGPHRAGSTGPRLPDYAPSVGRSDVSPVQLGLLGVPTPATNERSAPVSLPGAAHARATSEDDALNLLALRSGTTVVFHAHAPTQPRAHMTHAHSLSLSDVPATMAGSRFGYDLASGVFGHACTPAATGGWSLPRSSVRSKSGSSRSGSQSASESRSDDEDEAFGDLDDGSEAGEGRARVYGTRMRLWKTEEDGDEDGGVTLREEREDEEDKVLRRGADQAWDGMEMDMEMD